MRNIMKKIVWCILFASPALMNSCLGVAADIVINADGSGRIALEYRVSQMLESMGRLDGNGRWPAIPVGRADFERSLARIPGMRLASFSAKEAANASGDRVTSAVLEFKNTAALLAFLDNAGSHASLIQEGGKNTLRLALLDPSAAVNADLLSLLREIFADYEISLTFTTPKNAALSITPPTVTAARLVPQGKKVSFAIGLGELAGLENGLSIEVAW